MTNQPDLTSITTIGTLVEEANQAIANTLGDPWTELDDETKAALVQAEGEIRVAIATLEAAKDRLEEVLKTIPAGTENAEHIAGFKVGVKQGSTFDPARFAADHPVDQYPSFYEAKPVLKAIKEELSPAQLKTYYNDSNPSLDFKAL